VLSWKRWKAMAPNAKASGAFALGGELPVTRLGYGTM
jgi:hypothetical protein